MGMDVFGNDPTKPKGEHFRRNVWRWHPLANLVCTIAPGITNGCHHWHSNEGDGLGEDDAKALAKALRRALKSGRVRRLIAKRERYLAGLPNDDCDLCSGTGVRRDAIGIDSGDPEKIIGPDTDATPNHPRFGQKGWCNGCDGHGWKRPFECHYHVDAEDVADFAAFLECCGGFEIC